MNKKMKTIMLFALLFTSVKDGTIPLPHHESATVVSCSLWLQSTGCNGGFTVNCALITAVALAFSQKK